VTAGIFAAHTYLDWDSPIKRTPSVPTDSLQSALERLEPGEKPIVHSDQGFQYRHPAWQGALAGAGLTQSMSRKGNCLDNAAMEG